MANIKRVVSVHIIFCLTPHRKKGVNHSENYEKW